MLDLSNITLVSIDSAADHLSKNNIRLAVMSKIFPKIIENINFGDILLINPFNKNAHLIDEKFDVLWEYDFDTKERNIMWYSNFLIKKLPHLIKTDWYLIVQWDGFPFCQNPKSCWKDEFFEFQFLGGGHSVFNGGFSLRNTETMKQISECKDTFGTGAEDGFYSKFFDNKYKENIETPFKIKWEEGKIIDDFCLFGNLNKIEAHFGWHRSGFLSEMDLYKIYTKFDCFNDGDIRKILNYSASKSLFPEYFVNNYMKYFDMEFNSDFYNY